MALTAAHFALVGFMIEPGEVQQAVKDEYLEFDRECVPLPSRLAKRRWHADGQIPGDFFLALGQGIGRKGKDIRRLVFTAKLPVQAANVAVSRQENRNLALQANRRLRFAQKT